MYQALSQKDELSRDAFSKCINDPSAKFQNVEEVIFS